jgi:hypothetical protein
MNIHHRFNTLLYKFQRLIISFSYNCFCSFSKFNIS